MTPLQSSMERSDGQCHSSSFSEDSTEGMDMSVSSPPRSASRSTNGSLHSNLLFDPAEARTPKSRRLFGDDAEDGNIASPGRPSLKPLDLNHELASTQAPDIGTLSLSSVARLRRPRCSIDSDMGSDDGISDPAAVPPVNRKRTSNERRQQKVASPKTPYRKGSGGLFAASSNDSASMHTSPHISPNSFITMDGRYVQSKNPFSSPYMDEESLTPKGGRTQHMHLSSDGHSAPAFPLSFPTSHEESGHGHILPRRAAHRAAAVNNSPLNGGFPDHRFSFTGSPIAEHPPTVSSAQPMETDTPSSGSLHKVRRLSREDDIVAAHSQHIRNLAAANRPPPVDTAVLDVDHDNISPTDVQSFPTPPTPMKARRGSPPPPYARIQRREPTTPARHRQEQLNRTLLARTPHPKGNEGTTTGVSNSRFHSDFDVIGELGKGSFGTVFKVLSRLDGCMYAIKLAGKARGNADRNRMLKEVYALAALSDQADMATFHIVRYHQAWMEDDQLYIQTELCSGTLTDERNYSGRLPQQRRYKLLREILLALDFIHRHNMVHLDIKPDNIFLKNDQYKLGDFGLVHTASASNDVEEGDSRYMSMELLSGDSTDLTKSDIFSLGITMYELCRDVQLPMNGAEWQDLRSNRFVQPLPDTPRELSEIVAQMMQANAAFRPSARDLLTHPELLSDDQKALIMERNKVANATRQLAQMNQVPAPPKRKMVRANTWNGSSMFM